MSVLAVDPVYGSDELVEVAVTRHLDCECGCRIEADQCDPSIQVYQPDQCRCVCRQDHENSCGQNQFWDPESCTCRCRNEGGECSTGLFYSRDSCRCEGRPGGGEAGRTTSTSRPWYKLGRRSRRRG